jgi:hypothetical protein
MTSRKLRNLQEMRKSNEGIESARRMPRAVDTIRSRDPLNFPTPRNCSSTFRSDQENITMFEPSLSGSLGDPCRCTLDELPLQIATKLESQILTTRFRNGRKSMVRPGTNRC